MSEFNVYYDEKNNCMITSFQGELNTEIAKESSKELAREATKHKCTHVLNDLRKANSALSTVNIVCLPEALGKKGIDKFWKRAIVVSEDHNKGDCRLFETAAFNRGYTAKVFTDIDEAMNWLKSSERE